MYDHGAFIVGEVCLRGGNVRLDAELGDTTHSVWAHRRRSAVAATSTAIWSEQLVASERDIRLSVPAYGIHSECLSGKKKHGVVLKTPVCDAMP